MNHKSLYWNMDSYDIPLGARPTLNLLASVPGIPCIIWGFVWFVFEDKIQNYKSWRGRTMSVELWVLRCQYYATHKMNEINQFLTENFHPSLFILSWMVFCTKSIFLLFVKEIPLFERCNWSPLQFDIQLEVVHFDHKMVVW